MKILGLSIIWNTIKPIIEIAIVGAIIVLLYKIYIEVKKINEKKE